MPRGTGGGGMGARALRDFFDTMALALNFDTADQVSAKVILTVLSHFGKETDASRVAFLRGTPQRRLFEPFLRTLAGRGVTFLPDEQGRARSSMTRAANRVTGFRLDDGRLLTADAYVSAMPVHNLWQHAAARPCATGRRSAACATCTACR